ncbi:MAG: histone deacetylase [Dethiobacteria bacterium]|nr:histone deacetylase [Dethiobacteria bacterium]
MKNSAVKVGIVYHPDYLIHTQGQHPERKERLEHINAALREEGLLDKIVMREPKPAAVDDIALVHSLDHIIAVEEACLSGKRFLDMDTYIVPESYKVALLSTGGALEGLRMVMDDPGIKTFVLNRPPGHHAEKNQAMGFCLFNNVAVAAVFARRDYGLQRIAIVDWDVHHGNGTQHSFEDDPAVLFISIHQSPAYPGTGNLGEVGRGDGEGYTVNIPLPAGCGDRDYVLFYEQVIVPILDQFKPELIIVSAGQDAYHQDPLAGMALTHKGYYYMAETLAGVADRWAEGRMLLCLEGGYHLQGQAGAVMQILSAIGQWGLPIGEKSPDLEPNRQVQHRLEEVLAVQRNYWNI